MKRMKFILMTLLGAMMIFSSQPSLAWYTYGKPGNWPIHSSLALLSLDQIQQTQFFADISLNDKAKALAYGANAPDQNKKWLDHEATFRIRDTLCASLKSKDKRDAINRLAIGFHYLGDNGDATAGRYKKELVETARKMLLTEDPFWSFEKNEQWREIVRVTEQYVQLSRNVNELVNMLRGMATKQNKKLAAAYTDGDNIKLKYEFMHTFAVIRASQNRLVDFYMAELTNGDSGECPAFEPSPQEQCARERPGSVPTGRDERGRVICDCPQGYAWKDAAKTACEKELSPQEYCSRNYTGSVPTGRGTEGRVICECPAGYGWKDVSRTACVKQLSPQETCNRLGHGLIANGTTHDGKINCVCPQGLTWNASRRVCEKLTTPQEYCSANYSGSVPIGRDASGNVKCGCPQGSALNANNRRCEKKTPVVPPPDCSHCKVYEDWLNLKKNADACWYQGNRLPSICAMDPECVRWNQECNRVKKQLGDCQAKCRGR